MSTPKYRIAKHRKHKTIHYVVQRLEPKVKFLFWKFDEKWVHCMTDEPYSGWDFHLYTSKKDACNAMDALMYEQSDLIFIEEVHCECLRKTT